jgi:histone deacetylase 11
MHPFDIKKYQKIHDAMVDDGLCQPDQFLSPRPIGEDDLLLVHSRAYLQSLKSRPKVAGYLEAPVLMLAPVSLDTAILSPFRHASGGTLLAARKALESGVGINLGGGYHHAKPDKGEGFCLFADVPIAIRRLQQEKLIERAIVIDVDVHQGNGTIACLPDDETTFTFSMHQGAIYPIPKEKGDLDVELQAGMNDDQYLKILAKHLPAVFDQANADICFIVGGCDTLAGDPLASLSMTPTGIVRRDQMIVDECVKRSLPVVLTLSGGYSKDAWKAQYKSIKNLIERQKLAAPSNEPN